MTPRFMEGGGAMGEMMRTHPWAESPLCRKWPAPLMDKQPGLKVLFVTGYAEQAVGRRGLLNEGMQMITKPFVIDELANRIRAILRDEAIPRAR